MNQVRFEPTPEHYDKIETAVNRMHPDAGKIRVLDSSKKTTESGVEFTYYVQATNGRTYTKTIIDEKRSHA